MRVFDFQIDIDDTSILAQQGLRLVIIIIKKTI